MIKYILKSCTKILKISTATSINQPLWQNPNITVNIKIIKWTKWKDNGIIKLWHILSNDHFKTFNELSTEYGISNGEYLNYMTLQQSRKKSILMDKLNNDTNKFQISLFYHNLHNKNIVKIFYAILNDSTSNLFRFVQ